MEETSFDYIIVGGGPAGLACAHFLEKNKSVLIIDAHESLGGCNRVIRQLVNGEQLFSEHSPRIYSGTYVNFKGILQSMGKDFDKMFTPRVNSLSYFNVANQLSLNEMSVISLEFLKFLVCPWNQQFQNRTMQELTVDFSPKSKHIIDTLCRFTDGAGADRYSVRQFFQLINQQFFYQTCEPVVPNDDPEGLFPVWQTYLESNGRKFQLGTRVTKINNIGSLFELTTSSDTFHSKNVILAIPPRNLMILSPPGVFPGLTQRWVSQTSYSPYISVAFHWNKKLDVRETTDIFSLPWGLITVPMSNYSRYRESQSQTLISGVFIYLNRPGLTGRTANNSNKKNLIKEALLELNVLYPELPTPTVVLLSPELKRENHQWTTNDTAYIHSAGTDSIQSESTINGLYCLGTYNGHSPYEFTSVESAVSNGIKLASKLNNESTDILFAWTLRQVMILVVAVIVSLVVLTGTWVKTNVLPRIRLFNSTQ